MADMLATPVELGIYMDAPANTLPEDRVTQALEGATAEIQRAAGQRFVRATSTVVLDGRSATWDRQVGAWVLPLPQRPVVSVGAVQANGLPVTGWGVRSGALVAALAWYGLPAAPSPDLGLVTVTYTHGFAAVPVDVKDLALRLAAERYPATAGSQVESESIDDYTVRFATAAADAGRAPGTLTTAERLRLRNAFGAGTVHAVALTR